jgi:aldehyde dehydrogenase (NAD+)
MISALRTGSTSHILWRTSTAADPFLGYTDWPLHQRSRISDLSLSKACIDSDAFDAMQAAIAVARASGGIVHGVERGNVNGGPSFYARPALIEIPARQVTCERRLLRRSYTCCVTRSWTRRSPSRTTPRRTRPQFRSDSGFDCGIENVNMGTSGAEIGGAFGG